MPSALGNQAVGADAILAVQDPVWLDDHCEPLPDIALLRLRLDDALFFAICQANRESP
jgi:hypothetical protein